jgi:hypothetical protein
LAGLRLLLGQKLEGHDAAVLATEVGQLVLGHRRRQVREVCEDEGENVLEQVVYRDRVPERRGGKCERERRTNDGGWRVDVLRVLRERILEAMERVIRVVLKEYSEQQLYSLQLQHKHDIFHLLHTTTAHGREERTP